MHDQHEGFDHEVELVRKMRMKAALEGMLQIAKMLAAYHAALLNEGIDIETARWLTLEAQQFLLSSGEEYDAEDAE